MENDDFIEDDDGSGYVDHGEDEWGGHESSEDEDDFEGEDEELRKGELPLDFVSANYQPVRLSERVRRRRRRSLGRVSRLRRKPERV